MSIILDSSAVLALLWKEPGAKIVAKSIGRSSISAVNASEVIAKMVDRGIDGATAERVLLTLGMNIISFDAPTSILAGQIRHTTKSLGLSLGDRSCIALGIIKKRKVLTADRAWAKIDMGIQIELIR
ncbi:MAG: type II toxin-antitoxin system VapC family toxin [Robiginitomaculum sp.]|nr:type II toxin-antitoxin system VapC family toxin [Robiginitomaculum sp.]